MEKALMESPGYVCHAMQLVQTEVQKQRYTLRKWLKITGKGDPLSFGKALVGKA